MKKKKIVYATYMDFSHDNASTLRVVNICKAISNEYDVCIIGTGCSGKEIGNNINYLYISRNHINSLFKKGLQRIKYPYLVINELKMMSIKPDLIVGYGLYGYNLYILQRYCRKNKIPFVYDAVEWYQYSHFKMGALNPKVWQIHWTMKSLLRRCDGIICISTFLYNFYKNYSLSVLFVPPLMEKPKVININKEQEFDHSFLNIVYAGSPEKKDKILYVVDGIQQLFEKGYKIRLYIIGTTYEQFYKTHVAVNHDCVVCTGRLQRTEVLEYLNSADFSVIVRDDNQRYAKAGFSTKFVESLSLGVPIIANITGDMDMYLKNEYNGYVMKNASVESFVEIIPKIINDLPKKKEMLKANAYSTFCSSFTLETYRPLIIDFFEQISQNYDR